MLRLSLGPLISAVLALPAFADDWAVTKLRGTAEAMAGEAWVALKRGDVVSDDRLIRTLADSRIELQRGDDIIALDADTQVRIEDKLEDATALTVVRQDFGTVEVEAEVKETNHLTVETPYLAAVVKGTHFIVTADETGASVEVTRGLVAVEAAETKQSTSVEAGNVARVEPKGAMWVTGSAPVPKLFDGQGLEIPMPAMGRSAAAPPRRAPAISGASDTTQVAMNSPSAGLGVPLQMAGGGDASATAAPAQGGGLDIATAGIGIAVGIMLGSLGLLFRRLFR